jgi:hypothetical protein
MYELYEDLKDKEVIDAFEIEEKKEKTKFIEFDELFE